ncbi:MAG: ATP-grasp domain-containing protein [Promethearchaeota archaeon]
MTNQKLFIFEFVSGGGYNQLDIPSSLFCEGYAMLRTITEDFKKLGFQITTLLDKRISHLSPYLKTDTVKFVNPKDDYLKIYTKCVKKSAFCFIIAPEFSKHLYNLTQIAKDLKKTILSIDLSGVWLGTSKLKTYNYFIANKVNTPITYKIPLKRGEIDVDFILQKFDQLGSSIIMKPEDGAGAELIFHFTSKDQILQLFERAKIKLDVDRSYVVQEFIDGDDLSISIINRTNLEKNDAIDQIILSLNAQNVQNLDSNKDSLYLGGFTPVENYDVLRNIFEKILKSMDLTGFQGYFGIDFIKKADNSIYFIEINPRLTTSYIGIRNILDYNPLELLFNRYKSKFGLTKVKPKRFSHFTRLELKYSGDDSFENIRNAIIPKIIKLIPEIVTPPIALQSSNITQELIYHCFISTKAKNSASSKDRISQIIKILNKFDFIVIK